LLLIDWAESHLRHHSRLSRSRPEALGFRPFGPVLGAALLPIRHSGSIQCSANNVVAHPGKILHAASPDQHNGVLLEVVSHARDISRDFNPVRQPHPRHFAQRRIGLFRRGGVYARTDAAFLGTGLERGTGGSGTAAPSSKTYQLIMSRHRCFSPSCETPCRPLYTERRRRPRGNCPGIRSAEGTQPGRSPHQNPDSPPAASADTTATRQ